MVALLILGAAALWGEPYRLAWVTPEGDVWSFSAAHAVYVVVGVWALRGLISAIGAAFGRIFGRLRALFSRPFFKSGSPRYSLQAAEEAFRAGRLRRVLRLLRTSAKTDPAALRFVMRTQLMRRRPDLALEALTQAVRSAPASAHAALYRRVRPLVSPSALMRFREVLRVQPDVPAVRRLRALDAFLDGRTDEAVMRDIAVAAPPLRAELLRAAVRARRSGNDAAAETVLLAALPDEETRDDEAVAAAVAWLFAGDGLRPITALRPPGADGTEDYAQT